MMEGKASVGLRSAACDALSVRSRGARATLTAAAAVRWRVQFSQGLVSVLIMSDEERT